MKICYITLYCMCMCERERKNASNLIYNALLDKLKTIAISDQVTADVSCRSCVMRRN